jgi:hypothetical protein
MRRERVSSAIAQFVLFQFLEPSDETAVETAVDKLFDEEARLLGAALESVASRDLEVIARSLHRLRESRTILQRRIFTTDDLHVPG